LKPGYALLFCFFSLCRKAAAELDSEFGYWGDNAS